MAAKNASQPLPVEASVLTKAVSRAAVMLQLTNAQLARVLGLSAATASRLHHGTFMLTPGSKEYEIAALFVRLFRSLDAIMGGDDSASQKWLRSENRALGAMPLDRIQSLTGLFDVVAYLDARRAPI